MKNIVIAIRITRSIFEIGDAFYRWCTVTHYQVYGTEYPSSYNIVWARKSMTNKCYTEGVIKIDAMVIKVLADFLWTVKDSFVIHRILSLINSSLKKFSVSRQSVLRLTDKMLLKQARLLTWLYIWPTKYVWMKQMCSLATCDKVLDVSVDLCNRSALWALCWGDKRWLQSTILYSPWSFCLYNLWFGMLKIQ